MSSRHLNWSGLIVTSVILILTVGLVIGLLRENTVVAMTNDLNLRQGPGLRYAVTTTVSKNTRLTVIDRRDNWYRVTDHQNKTGWVASWLVDRPTPLKKATTLSEATIVLDPGHGGQDSGALSVDGHHDEKTYTLALAQEVQHLLTQRGARVIMTRDRDQTVSLAKRPEVANDQHADAFISFHFDSSPVDNEGSGTTTYYYHAQSSLGLAQALNAQFNNLPLANKGVAVGNFEVIRDNRQPAVLLEMGYINNTKDFKKISSAAYRQQVATDVVAGLTRYVQTNPK